MARCLVGGALLALTGCTLRPEILSAESSSVGDEEVVTVFLRSADAERIKNREIYFSVLIVDCAGAPDGFPSEPYTDGERASEFRFSVTGASVAIVTRVPAGIYARYPTPCVFLLGGSYFMGRIESATVPVESARPGPTPPLKPAPSARLNSGSRTAPIMIHELHQDSKDDTTHPIPRLGVIDVAVYYEDPGGAELTIVIAAPLLDDENSHSRLLEKIDGYLGHIASEQFRVDAGASPSAENTTITIAMHPDSAAGVFTLLERCHGWVASANAKLVVRSLTDDELTLP